MKEEVLIDITKGNQLISRSDIPWNVLVSFAQHIGKTHPKSTVSITENSINIFSEYGCTQIARVHEATYNN